MRLPNSERALVELAKLADYCLDPSHLRGQHKARVFASRLGLGRNEASTVRAALLEAANQAENVVRGAVDGFGSRYILDFRLSGPKGSVKMAPTSISNLDVVALLTDVPEQGLVHGQVGTVVEHLADNVFEVEFIDDEGQTYAELPLPADQLLVLHHRRIKAA